MTISWDGNCSPTWPSYPLLQVGVVYHQGAGVVLVQFPTLLSTQLDLRHPEPFSYWVDRGHRSQYLFPHTPQEYLLLSKLILLIKALQLL